MNAISQKRLLIVGCGYVGAQVAKRAIAAGQKVFGLTRGRERFSELAGLGVEPVEGDWTKCLEPLPETDQVLVAVPHREVSGLGVQSHVVGLENLLNALPAGWSKLLYLSSTGVYGDGSKGMVDESTHVNPLRIGPQVAVAAEQWLQQTLIGSELTILRLAGIYGPGRIPLAAKLKAGQDLAVPKQGCLNLVHVQDIARMIQIVFGRSMELPCYVFSDGRPIVRADFYRYLASLCGVSNPKFVQPSTDDGRTRRATDKRIDPSRLISETGFSFQFPDYRIGLKHALNSEE